MTVCICEWEKWDFQDLKVITIILIDFYEMISKTKCYINLIYEWKSIEMEIELETIEIVKLMKFVIESQPTYIIFHSCSIVK